MAVSIGTTTQNVYPPRVLVTLTGLTPGDPVTVFRQVTGTRVLVRAGSTSSVGGTTFDVIDAELPFGIPVAYVAVVAGVEHATSPVTYTLPGGKVVLSDAITGLAAEVTIMSASVKTRSRDATRFRASGRNIIVSQPRSKPEGAYKLFLDNTTALNSLYTLLDGATQSIIQVRQPGGYDGIDAFLAVDGDTEERWSQDGTDPRRTVTIEWAQVDGWPAELAALGWTYADVESYYTGQTYADLDADYATYFDLLQGDFS